MHAHGARRHGRHYGGATPAIGAGAPWPRAPVNLPRGRRLSRSSNPGEQDAAKARSVFHDSFDAGEVGFDDVEVLSAEDGRVEIRFTDADGRTVDVSLDKKKVRDLVNWRMLL